MLDINYDERYDVLYISIGDRKNAIGCEEFGGVTVFRDRDTDEVVGLMVLGRNDKATLPKTPRV